MNNKLKMFASAFRRFNDYLSFIERERIKAMVFLGRGWG